VNRMLNGMFKKTTSYMAMAGDLLRRKENSDEVTDSAEAVISDEKESAEKPSVPEGMFIKCPKCRSVVYTKDIEDNLHICPKCGHYHRIGAYERISMVVDEDTFEEWDSVMEHPNPLDYPGYSEKLELLRDEYQMDEAVVCGKGQILGQETVIAVMDARFMMASMGGVVGEKITRAIEKATALSLPVIIFTCSGGARMQEGMVSLMQMAKTSAALGLHAKAGLPYFTVVTDPTTGGVSASFATLGDVILAEPDALIGFAGQRVIEQTIGQKLPKGFQRAEFALEHGQIDMIVERKDLKQTLADLIVMHRPYEVVSNHTKETDGEA
jgi:acetyl-CoA carboxylase carboxyl transferase beta subunit